MNFRNTIAARAASWVATTLHFLLLASFLSLGCDRNMRAQSTTETMLLSNGIKVVSVHFPGSTNVSLFTFLPMGLTADAPNQAQWSHLVEHLIIQSTRPGLQRANAETLPDHMRLDFYGTLENWKEGFDHHRRWMEGVPFTEESLAAEKPKVIAECDFTAKNFATHKFALAAWSHGWRHGKKHIALKGDVLRAELPAVQQLRDQQAFVSNQVTLCVVGGLKSNEVFQTARERLDGLELSGWSTKPIEPLGKELDLTWDLDARHLTITWPIPDFRHADHAPLLVIGHWLNFQLNADARLKEDTGMVLAGADLTTPEGAYFFISASLRPSADFETVTKALLDRVETLHDPTSRLPLPFGFAKQIASSLTEIPDIRAIKAQAPPGLDIRMIEGNIGLQAGMRAHRYGDHLEKLAEQISHVTTEDLRETSRRHLSRQGAAISTLRPASGESDESDGDR